jgi:hypothetical protein
MPQFDYLFSIQLLILLQKDGAKILTCIITVPMGLTARALSGLRETIEWHNGELWIHGNLLLLLLTAQFGYYIKN